MIRPLVREVVVARKDHCTLRGLFVFYLQLHEDTFSLPAAPALELHFLKIALHWLGG